MKQSTKRLISFAVALVFIFGALFIFSSLIRPVYSEALERKSRLFSQEELLKNQKAAVDQVKALINTYKGEGSFAEVAAIALPNTKQEAEAIHQVTELARVNSLTIQTLAVTAPSVQNISDRNIPKAGTKGGDIATLAKPVGNLNIQLRLAGTYASFRAFLQNIETNIRIMDMRNVGVSPVGKPNQDFYLFDVAVVAYYQNL
ncbi:MAG: hypothetical protein AAB495_04605 [Patescibacteria group bacterium]